MTREEKHPFKKWVGKGTELAEEYQKIWNAQGKQMYSTKSDTKAAFAERTIWWEKTILHCFMEEYGYKYNKKNTAVGHKFEFFTKTFDLLKPKSVKFFEFFSIRYKKHLRRRSKTTFVWRISSHLKVWFAFPKGLQVKKYARFFLNCCVYYQEITFVHN